MRLFNLFHVKLAHFDGEGAGAAPTGEQGPGEQGERLLAEAAARNPRAKKADPYANVVFGKQPEGEVSNGQAAADNGQGVTTPQSTLEDRRKAYNEFINDPQYKEFYTNDTQKMIDRRFKETKNLEKQVSESKPVIDMLMQRYGVKDMESLQTALEGDSAYWQEAADEAGMSVSQYMEFQKLQRENRALLQQQQMAINQQKADQQLMQWTMEGEALKQKFPNFDIKAEAQNPEFLRLLQSGTPVEHAYKVIHFDELLDQERMATAAFTQQQVAENIKARGQRPQEAGLNSNNAIQYKTDVASMTNGDIFEAVRRAQRGEIISFS